MYASSKIITIVLINQRVSINASGASKLHIIIYVLRQKKAARKIYQYKKNILPSVRHCPQSMINFTKHSFFFQTIVSRYPPYIVCVLIFKIFQSRIFIRNLIFFGIKIWVNLQSNLGTLGTYRTLLDFYENWNFITFSIRNRSPFEVP